MPLTTEIWACLFGCPYLCVMPALSFLYFHKTYINILLCDILLLSLRHYKQLK